MSLLMYPDSMPKQILRVVTLTFSQMGKMNVKEKKPWVPKNRAH